MRTHRRPISDDCMKKDPINIIERMFKALEEGKPFSINELAQETGCHNLTIRKYVRLIEIVREEPAIEIIKTRHSIIIRMRK